MQYEPWLDGAYRPAVRFDTAHGVAHRDLLDWRGDATKDWAGAGVTLPLNEAFSQALHDIRANWERYRAAFLQRKP